MPSAVSRTAKYLAALTASAVPSPSAKYLMKVLAASILAASPLSNTPKPQMPPCSLLSPVSEGKLMNTIFSPSLVSSASLLSVLSC